MKKTSRIPGGLAALMLAACAGENPPDYQTSGTDADSDADTDADSDADTDADSDADTDADADSDSDSDADTDADADSDSDTDTDTATFFPQDCAGGRYDSVRDLCWQYPPPDETLDWENAVDYCDDLDLAGHTDWTLPGRQDFVDLLGGCDDDVLGGNAGYCDSCADSSTCSSLFGPDEDWYWSSSPVGGASAWFAYFFNGYVEWLLIDNEGSTRCVHPGQ
jgi:hypothetical protein